MYLGIDLGTSGVKATLIDSGQRNIGSAQAPLEVMRPQSGWSEQNPADWIAATEAALTELGARHRDAFTAVRGIGLSGQMHGAVVLDARDQPLRPCILWNDTRAHREAAELDADAQFRALTGNIVFPGFTAPKLVWLQRHEPAVFDAIRTILLPKDYLRLWLTGERVSDMSDAAGTSWLETGARRWSAPLLAATGVAAAQLPALAEGTAVTGTLRAQLAARFGLRPTTVVAGGAGDNAASACGMGVVRAGAAFVSLGTSGVLFAATDTYRPNAASAVHTFCHALPAMWHQMGVILSATDSLNWLARITGSTAAELTAELGERLRVPGAVTFLPYLSGERTPHNDATLRGAFGGLSHATDRSALTQALLEGVAFAFRDNLAALQAAGTDVERVVAVGGGARSRYWLQAIATALDVAVGVPTDADVGAALGAARLGLIAAEGADPLAVCTAPAIAATIEPDAARAAEFRASYERFVELTRRTRESGGPGTL